MPRITLSFVAALLLAACATDDSRSQDATTLHAEEGFVIEAVTVEDVRDRVVDVDEDFVVVNFWASWCAPCREEFPELIRFDREHPNVAVRFVSLDFEEDLHFAADFLRDQQVEGTTYLRTGSDRGFQSAVSADWTGSLPATAVFARDGRILAFWEGKVDYETLVYRVEEAGVPL